MAKRFNFGRTIIPRAQYLDLSRVIDGSNDYGPVTRGRLSGWNKLAAKLSSEYNSTISVQQIVSIRSALLKQRIVKNYYKISSNAAKIAAEYSSGVDIMTLSHKYSYPPLSLLRAIFESMKKYRKTDISAVFRGTRLISDIFCSRDLEQYAKASAADILESSLQRRIHEIAARNEKIFVEKFKSAGIRIKTQDDLTAEQIEADGKATLTPDILLEEPLFINGKRVFWIDYKDYVGTPVGFLLSSNRKQAAKYTARWGPGALFFNGGVVEGVEIESTQLLDASIFFASDDPFGTQ